MLLDDVHNPLVDPFCFKCLRPIYEILADLHRCKVHMLKSMSFILVLTTKFDTMDLSFFHLRFFRHFLLIDWLPFNDLVSESCQLSPSETFALTCW